MEVYLSKNVQIDYLKLEVFKPWLVDIISTKYRNSEHLDFS